MNTTKCHFCLYLYLTSIFQFIQGQFYGTVAAICKVNNDIFCQNNSCIHFCCGQREYFNQTLELCQPYLNPNESETFWLPEVSNNTRFITKAQDCEVHIYDNRTQDIKILGDGSVEIDGIIWPYDQYCASFVEGQNGDEVCWHCFVIKRHNKL